MLNGLAEFNRVGLAQSYYKSCWNSNFISFQIIICLYFVLVHLGHRPVC